MSLNDPRWGRSSDEQDKEARNDDADRSQNSRDDQSPESGEKDPNERQNRNARGERGQEDLDRLWGEFSDLLGSMLGRDKDPRRSSGDPLSKLKSRDDFSRDDEDDAGAPRSGRGQESGGYRDRGEDIPDDGGRSAGGRTGLFGGSGGGRGSGSGNSFGGIFQGRRPPKVPGKAGGISLSVLAGCAVLGWAVSGFYIVPEGQTGVVTTFGAYERSTMPGINWHIPAPIQSVELVDVSSVRTAQIGMQGSADRLREALMLTDDENIVDVQFNVQYRIKPESGARDYLFNTRSPDTSVTQAAESAMREVVGRKAMDSVLFESKAEIAEAVRVSMQAMLDRYSTGIDVMSVAIQNAQPPQQVQAAFNDAVKAGQDRERSINLGEAYMNAVIPKAQGTASRLKEEAEGYKARVVETARGDADRFMSVFDEYSKAPEVTRDRIYVDAMKDVYSRVTKVYVDQREGSSLLYLPLDKLVASTQAAAQSEAAASVAAPAAQPSNAAPVSSSGPSTSSAGATYRTDADPRDMMRTRLR